MKRYVTLVLACTLVLAVGSTAMAQSVPVPVVRMGDWIEIADDTWMNLIFSTEWHYVTSTNNDFEGDIRDRPSSRDVDSTTVQSGDCDCLWEETRFGADLRFQKNLTVRVLFENQFTMDGNIIDNGWSDPNDVNGRQRNTVNLERAWIRYEFPHTGLTLQVGASLWTLDQAAVIGDDDPRIALFYKVGNLEFQAAAVVQTESLRYGLENDNDDIYYTFGVDYNAKPWQFGLHGAYFRFRADGATLPGATQRATQGQKQDSVLIMPSARGQFGIVKFLVQPMVIFGSADRSDAGVTQFGSRSMDIFAWGLIGAVEANLGKIRPFFLFALGSGDDDVNDNDLNGFSPLPQGEITLTTGQPEFSVLTQSTAWGGRDVGPPARANLPGVGNEFMHSVGDPFNTRIGNNVSGLSTTYSNTGTFTLVPGVKIFPVKGHELDLWYAYRRVMESAPIEAELGGVNVDKSMVHDLGAMYTWSVNKHFDIRAVGQLSLLAAGGKDIAETVVCDAATNKMCKGEDAALRGELRFRARF